MILTTTPSIEGHRILEYKGVVTGEAVAGIDKYYIDPIYIKEKSMKEIEKSMKEIKENAAQLGANAIVGIKLIILILLVGDIRLI